MDARELGAVFAGGVAGALARAGVNEALPIHAGQWPWATLLVNVAGAALLGWVVAGPRYHRLLGTGFCGALTTFSTLQLELLRMLDDDRFGLALGYVAVTLAAGLLAVGVAGRLRHR
jgi:CrcB protein